MISFRTFPPSIFVSLACPAFLIVLLFLCTACDTGPRQQQQADGAPSYLEIDTIRIPIFSTSEEQFNYTLSWFAERTKKRAALQAYRQLYPEQKRNCGLAALDLAYLQLGSDYRFAHEKAYFAALASYNSILEEFVDYPQIMAKALWYIGWISMDLLYDRKRGLEAYRQVVREYPREPVSLLPPAPWVSIIYPQDDLENAAAAMPSGRSWAALALVEIIKHTEDAETGWQAFLRLWQEYPEDIATGFGLRVVLRRQYHVDEVLPMARRFMDSNLSNIHLLSDIRKEVKAVISAEGASAEKATAEGASQYED